MYTESNRCIHKSILKAIKLLFKSTEFNLYKEDWVLQLLEREQALFQTHQIEQQVDRFSGFGDVLLSLRLLGQDHDARAGELQFKIMYQTQLLTLTSKTKTTKQNIRYSKSIKPARKPQKNGRTIELKECNVAHVLLLCTIPMCFRKPVNDQRRQDRVDFSN